MSGEVSQSGIGSTDAAGKSVVCGPTELQLACWDACRSCAARLVLSLALEPMNVCRGQCVVDDVPA